ncbi:MAG TPA: TIGR00270 family protein [Thermoplasmata archaeon]|nr:TIGR00270 family protein [Thermoplasmata archaeon]
MKLVKEVQCELCGKECSTGKYVSIDGVKMFVCIECSKYGTFVSAAPTSVKQKQRHQAVKPVIKRPAGKDVFENMTKVLVPDWAERIKKGRMKKGLSREELGFRVGERTVAIAKMENGDLRPSDETVKKLEKELGIRLFQEIEEVHLHTSKTHSGLTLGDILRMKEEHD